MLHITRVEDAPFFLLPHRTSGPKGKVRRNHLPIYRDYATGLPDTIEALAFTSDLQGRGASGRGGVSGIVGNPRQNQQRTEGDFLVAVRKVTARQPDLSLLPQEPAGEKRARSADPNIAISPGGTGYEGLTVFGHTRWHWPWLMTLGASQVKSSDWRLVVIQANR
ncbi:MAG: hypothetical protein HLX50_15760 [Alteromonadaceae bacterium]|nr:hypothetical protein [Alteromonadaceae bacterium]